MPIIRKPKFPSQFFDPEELDYLGGKPKKPRHPIKEPDDIPGAPTPPSSLPPSSPVEIKKQKSTASYRTLGVGENVRARSFDPLSAAREILRGTGTVKIVYDNFFGGINTAFKRGAQPNGSIYDCKNLLPNIQIGGLVQRLGYASYLTAPVTLVDGSSVGAIDFHWHLGTDNPSSTTIDVIGFSTGFAQKPFFKESTTATSSWVQWGELRTTTIASIAGNLLTFTLTAGSASDDYYNTWMVHNSTRSEFIYVTDYTGSSRTVTPLEKVPSDWLAGDTVVLYRHFHDNAGFAPAVGTEPAMVQLGDVIIGSGGQGAAAGRKPIWSGYVDLTFFSGATKTPRHQGTYVTESEVKTSGMTIGNAGTFASVGNGLDSSKRWFIAFLYETVDGCLSTLQKAGTNYTAIATDQGISTALTINFARWNKRIKKIHAFLGSVDSAGAPTTLDWSEYYHVDTIDLTGTGWTYTDSGAAPGTFSYTVQLDNRDWEAASVKSDATKESVVDWTGTTEYNRSIVSFSRAVVLENRLFLAKVYDYNAGKNLDDYVLWTDFSGVLGTPQYSVHPDIDGASQARIISGGTPSVVGLAKWQTRLLILKDRSCHEIDITEPDATRWQKINISNEIGCDMPNSIVETPHGVCFGKSGQDLYLYRGGEPTSLTADTIRPTFKSNTNGLNSTQKAQLWGWWNPRWQAYCVMTKASDLSEFYGTFFEIPVSNSNFAWYRFDLGHDINSVRLDKNGDVLFSSTNIYKMSDADVDDAGTSIKTFFDTGEHTLSERDITTLDSWWIANLQDGGATVAGTLDIQVLLDNAVVTFDSVSSEASNVTKTSTRWISGLPVGSQGRTIRCKINTDASPATWTPSSATAQQLTILELGFEGRVEELYGDQAQSL